VFHWAYLMPLVPKK
jgi:hypothetical protein